MFVHAIVKVEKNVYLNCDFVFQAFYKKGEFFFSQYVFCLSSGAFLPTAIHTVKRIQVR